jgi:hypothetical protein
MAFPFVGVKEKAAQKLSASDLEIFDAHTVTPMLIFK